MIHSHYSRVFAVFTVLLAGAGPVAAHAAATTLRITQPSGVACEGRDFAVNLRLDSTEAAINAIDTDVVLGGPVGVYGVNTSGSIFRFWAEGPEYAGPAGPVHMVGGLPTPGYQGSGGLVANLTLRAPGAGTVTVSPISTSKVLLNDGLGTETTVTTVGQSISVLPATDAACAAPTPGPTAPPGPPGPTATPVVCPETDQPVCELTNADGEAVPLRECQVRIMCVSSPTRTVTAFIPVADGAECPIVARCAADVRAELGGEGAVKTITGLVTSPGAAFRALRTGSTAAAFWVGFVVALLIVLICYVIRRLYLKHKERTKAK